MNVRRMTIRSHCNKGVTGKGPRRLASGKRNGTGRETATSDPVLRENASIIPAGTNLRQSGLETAVR